MNNRGNKYFNFAAQEINKKKKNNILIISDKKNTVFF